MMLWLGQYPAALRLLRLRAVAPSPSSSIPAEESRTQDRQLVYDRQTGGQHPPSDPESFHRVPLLCQKACSPGRSYP